MVLRTKRKFGNFYYTLIEDDLTQNEAINRAQAFRRDDVRTKRAFGRTGSKRNLYRIGKVGKKWGIFERRRGGVLS